MSTTGITWDPQVLALRQPIDPYFVWADITEFAGYFSQAPNGATEVPFLVEKQGNPSSFDTPQFALKDVGQRLMNSFPKILRWQLGAARSFKRAEIQVSANPEKANCVAAVLDDGCPLFHPCYAETNGDARIRWLWHQGISTPQPHWKAVSVPGTNVVYGAELTPTGISILAKSPIGEDERYRTVRYLTGPSEQSVDGWKNHYHGASVLSQVSGNPSPRYKLGELGNDPNPADWPTIFVQFPSLEPFDTSGGWLGVRVFDGLRYVIDRAGRGFQLPNEDKRPVPVVACVSYGGLAGSHDGTSMLESAMLRLLDTNKRLHIVLPAGNAFGRAIHAVAKPNVTKSATFSVFAPPDSPHPVFVELWLPSGTNRSKVCVTVTSPGGEESIQRSGPGHAAGLGRRFGIVFPYKAPQGMHGTMLLIAMQPTRQNEQAVSPRVDAAPAGVWKIKIESECTEINAWIERDDVAGRMPRAQQSRFVDDGAVNVVIDDDITLSSIANAKSARLHIVGSIYQFKRSVSLPQPLIQDEASAYSGSGPARSPSSRAHGPDWSAVSDVSPALTGVICEGARSGDKYRSAGTSVAAAIAARHLLSQLNNSGGVVAPNPTTSKLLGERVP